MRPVCVFLKVSQALLLFIIVYVSAMRTIQIGLNLRWLKFQRMVCSIGLSPSAAGML